MSESKRPCLCEEELRGFLDSSLSVQDEAATQEHLANCKKCQAQMDEWVTRGRGWAELKKHLIDLPTDSLEETADSLVNEQVDFASLLAPTDNPESLGKLRRYEIMAVIGRGSTGIVFKGYDPALHRNVAIKMLAPDLSFRGTSRKRFEREARAIAAVSHPNVIEVHGVDEFRGNPFFVMNYFPDGSLQNRIAREGWMSTKEVCRIGMQVARGLSEAHRQGIIHRDIKPANILLENGTERAVVSDFGLASVADEGKMTMSGMIAGTPQFMSPEQAKGQPLDLRTDLFSLGCVMYAACTGASPFQGETLMGVVNRVCEATPRAIRETNPEIAPWLAEFVEVLLSKDRNQRFQTAAEVDEVLTAELAYLQMPGSIKEPERAWLKNSRVENARLPWKGVGLTCLISILIGWGVLANWNSGERMPNQYGIVPTVQEASLVESRAVFELAYETHLNELGLRGDMAQSLAAHQKALSLGYDPGKSSYLIACSHAVEKNHGLAIEWLEKAVLAGFHDYDAVSRQAELGKLKTDPRFASLLSQIKELDARFLEADKTYFVTMDYARAEQLYRSWLKDCPQDERAIMMLGASLLEQGKLDEAEPWNERTRHSVRFANFGTYNLGCIAAQRGDFDLAFNYLNYSTEIGFTDADHLANDHHLIPLRKDLRFTKLLHAMRDKKGQD